jgi:transcription antitermination factor NusG
MPLLGRELDLFPQNGLELPEAEFPWLVAHTKSRQEKSLVRHLAPLGVPFYVPQQEKRTRRGGRAFVSYLPLFPGYVFFRGGAAERQKALRSNLLVRILEVKDQVLLGRELTQLRALQLSGASFLPLDELSAGDAVRVVEGPFKGYTGVVLRGQTRLRLVVSVSMLRLSVAVEFERSALAPLKPSSGSRENTRSAVA